MLNLNAQAYESLGDARALALTLQRVRELTQTFPHYAQPRAIILSLTPWTTANSLLTPTLKLKRLNLANHFAAEIKLLYQH